MYKAWFVNYWGHSFSRTFNTFEDMNEFIRRARKVGTKFIGFVGI